MASSQAAVCANWSPESTICKKTGGYTCKNCFLVAYCGAECQKSHWARHKSDCKSPMNKTTWQPGWAVEGRAPTFVSPIPWATFGGKKFLWGNIPALDVLKLGANEGEDYSEQLRLLFAASGDLRNVAKTIAQLPAGFNQPVEITMNDRDLDIVARNAIMLLIALVLDDVEEAVDCILHVWYSALIRPSDVAVLQTRIRPLVEEVCAKIKTKAPGSSILGKTWTFGGTRSLRLVLDRSSWDALLLFMEVPEDLTVERAREIRTVVTLAEARRDHRDRYLFCQPPARRVAATRFREDGLLLPFGARRDEFRVPNPTLFQSSDSWQMKDGADPINGWDLKEVEECSSGPATADIYGKLFRHVGAVLRGFVGRLRDLHVSFRLFQMDVVDLCERLHSEGESGSYSRIEVSNISDNGYLGIHRTLFMTVSLLQEPSANRHATLITLFMNAVDESLTDADKIADMQPHTVTTRRLAKYLPVKARPAGNYDPEFLKFHFARDVVATYDHIFDRFASKRQITEAAEALGAAPKSQHTIVEKWPFRLKLRPGQEGAQEEFERLLRSGVSGKERYIEWKRTI